MPKRKPPRHRATDDPRWTSELEPAPGELKIVQAFVNTAIPRQGSEELSSPRALGHFLTRWRLMGDDVELGEAELQTGLALREGARALLRANNGAALDRKAVDRFESATARVPMRLRVDTVEGTAYLGPADAGAAALGRLLGIFTAARLGASWPRFKACADPTCGAAFYDGTKNLGGKWCSLRCGNRIAARSRRRRERAAR